MFIFNPEITLRTQMNVPWSPSDNKYHEDLECNATLPWQGLHEDGYEADVPWGCGVQ